MIASRIFEMADQERFAALTGDHNPMHMDPIAARRTQAGAPVVHGMHSLLWLLDKVAEHVPDLPSITKLKCTFGEMVYLGEQVEARIVRRDANLLRAEVWSKGVSAIQMIASFADEQFDRLDVPDSEPLDPTVPMSLAFEDMAGRTGFVRFASEPEKFAALFPHAARLLGVSRLAALGCSTLLVGMVIPGLHSIYGRLTAIMSDDATLPDRIAYKVDSTDPRFRLVRLEIQGGGLRAQVNSFARQPPIGQPSMGEVAKLVRRDEFAGSTALVVGGSRGLGELTAKIVAAGGGKPIVTYAAGAADAASVADEIRSWGGLAEIMALDVRADIASQLTGSAPTHLYYFATPQIFRGRHAGFSQARFDEFVAFYVTGFHEVLRAALNLRPAGVAAFYPSSVYVAERPEHMTEYAMAKAAGEVLCQDLNVTLKGVRIVATRLPRLPTDQTASITETDPVDALAVMLPIVREVQGGR